MKDQIFMHALMGAGFADVLYGFHKPSIVVLSMGIGIFVTAFGTSLYTVITK